MTRNHEDATAFIKTVSEEFDSLHSVDDLNDESLSASLCKVVETVGDDLWKFPFFGKFIDDGYQEPSFVAKLQFEALQQKVQLSYITNEYMYVFGVFYLYSPCCHAMCIVWVSCQFNSLSPLPRGIN